MATYSPCLANPDVSFFEPNFDTISGNAIDNLGVSVPLPIGTRVVRQILPPPSIYTGPVVFNRTIAFELLIGLTATVPAGQVDNSLLEIIVTGNPDGSYSAPLGFYNLAILPSGPGSTFSSATIFGLVQAPIDQGLYFSIKRKSGNAAANLTLDGIYYKTKRLQ